MRILADFNFISCKFGIINILGLVNFCRHHVYFLYIGNRNRSEIQKLLSIVNMHTVFI